ncbi:MAG: helicase, partial [Tomitella sp.]|nr:helicase [Tomitella sp.]
MSDSRFFAEPVLGHLMDFQRDTVEHVFDTLHGERGSGRFLVADETGLGKSIVARGLVAKTIEHLQDVDHVHRIDVVYVCSNMDLARQNIGRLNVTAEEEIAFSSRLSMLAKHSKRLNSSEGRSTVNGKLVNLVSFTPSTSFDPGFAFGQAEERALLLLAMEEILGLDTEQLDWATRMLKGSVSSEDSMRGYVRRMREDLPEGIDPAVRDAFMALGTTSTNGTRPSLDTFTTILNDAMTSGELTPEIRDRVWPAVGHLRRDLAKAGIKTLEPDLVILDEFQRFRALLDDSTDAGELAGSLFSEHTAKVVLLSATPYKPFTYAEEDEDHAEDFINTIRFLHDEPVGADPRTQPISEALATYRYQVTAGTDAHPSAEAASKLLLQVMSRSERPLIEERSMLEEHLHPADELTAQDLAGYVRLKALASHLDPHASLVRVEYWKSAPYFLTFCNGYRLRQRLKDWGTNPDPALRSALAATIHITREQVDGRTPIDLGNARLRQLAADYLDTGAWRLLWMPPSLPYLEPDGVYAVQDASRLTKRLIFSSWAATPASVASLLSYEVNRRMIEAGSDSAESLRGRLLDYRAARTPGGRQKSMSTQMLFWHIPGLEELTNQRSPARSHGRTHTAALLTEARS